MGSVMLHVVLFVSLVQFQVVVCKPFLFDFLCDLVCDDDDSTSSSNDDYFGFNDLCSCGTPAPPTGGRKGNPPSVDLNLPGISVQMSNSNGQWSLNVNSNPSTPANTVVPSSTGAPAPGPPGPGMPGSPPPAGASTPPGAPPASTAATTAAASSAAPA